MLTPVNSKEKVFNYITDVIHVRLDDFWSSYFRVLTHNSKANSQQSKYALYILALVYLYEQTVTIMTSYTIPLI